MSDGKLVCPVCPHRCVLSEGKTGLCRARGLYQISGEDINSPRQSFICEALADYPNLFTATYALIGQEIAATENLDDALFSDAAKAKYPDLDERVAVYAKIGGIDKN